MAFSSTNLPGRSPLGRPFSVLKGKGRRSRVPELPGHRQRRKARLSLVGGGTAKRAMRNWTTPAIFAAAVMKTHTFARQGNLLGAIRAAAAIGAAESDMIVAMGGGARNQTVDWSQLQTQYQGM